MKRQDFGLKRAWEGLMTPLEGLVDSAAGRLWFLAGGLSRVFGGASGEADPFHHWKLRREGCDSFIPSSSLSLVPRASAMAQERSPFALPHRCLANMPGFLQKGQRGDP